MCYLLRLNNIKIFQTKYFFFVFNERKQKNVTNFLESKWKVSFITLVMVLTNSTSSIS